MFLCDAGAAEALRHHAVGQFEQALLFGAGQRAHVALHLLGEGMENRLLGGLGGIFEADGRGCVHGNLPGKGWAATRPWLPVRRKGGRRRRIRRSSDFCFSAPRFTDGNNPGTAAIARSLEIPLGAPI